MTPSAACREAVEPECGLVTDLASLDAILKQLLHVCLATMSLVCVMSAGDAACNIQAAHGSHTRQPGRRSHTAADTGRCLNKLARRCMKGLFNNPFTQGLIHKSVCVVKPCHGFAATR